MKNLTKTKKIIIAAAAAVLVIAAVVCGVLFGGKSIIKAPSEYKVTFLSISGSVLSEQIVPEGGTAVAPKNPEMPYGWIFAGWDAPLTNITQETTIRTLAAKPTSENSCIALSSESGTKGEEVCLYLTLCGGVEIAGFDVEIRYDAEKLRFERFEATDDMLVTNSLPEEGLLRLNYVSSENTLGDVDLTDLYFTILSAEPQEAPVTVSVTSAAAVDENGELFHCDCDTIPATVSIY